MKLVSMSKEEFSSQLNNYMTATKKITIDGVEVTLYIGSDGGKIIVVDGSGNDVILAM
ncbi:MAG: hypothetical protein ACXWT0_03890 [Methylobacter sp.]